MEIIRDFSNISNKYKKCVLTIGVFDGLHLGHQDIITQVIKKAHRLKKKSVVITFDPHPAQILNFLNGKNTGEGFLLTTLGEKIRLIKNTGIDCLFVLEFTKNFMKILPRDFICKIAESFNPKYILAGPNHTFGRDGKGTPFLLSNFGRFYGFKTVVLKPKKISGEFVTSTAIRKVIKKGDVKKAFLMLGRYFFITGRVVHGSRRGLSLGFPTANIETTRDKLIPQNGVYATFVKFGNKIYRGLVNIGFRPTFKGKKIKKIEVFIENFKGDLYNRILHIDFVSKLRNERKFPNKSALKKQIQRDIGVAAKLLKNKTI